MIGERYRSYVIKSSDQGSTWSYLSTIADDVAHGGNVWGVISASYTDLGGAGGVPALTTVEQTNVRQKRQQVEFVLEEMGRLS